MVTTTQQDKQFIEDMISSTLLEQAIAWIKDNFSPEDIFDEKELRQWAESSGYVEE
jgi:hypothetical protein